MNNILKNNIIYKEPMFCILQILRLRFNTFRSERPVNASTFDSLLVRCPKSRHHRLRGLSAWNIPQRLKSTKFCTILLIQKYPKTSFFHHVILLQLFLFTVTLVRGEAEPAAPELLRPGPWGRHRIFLIPNSRCLKWSQFGFGFKNFQN